MSRLVESVVSRIASSPGRRIVLMAVSDSLASSLPFPVEELLIAFGAVVSFLPCVLFADRIARAVVTNVTWVLGVKTVTKTAAKTE